jgi:hypothetical protein
MPLWGKPTDRELRDYKAGKPVRERVAREAADKAHRQAAIKERKAQDAKDRKEQAKSIARVKRDNAKSARTNTGKKSSSWW